jgi:hypothetical protein
MTTTISEASRQDERRAPGFHALAGSGGLLFVAVVVAQNIVRGVTAPANGATPAAIARSFAEHRGIERGLVVAFVASGVALSLFVAGTWTRVARERGRAWGQVFFLGACGVLAIFSTLVGLEISLLVATDRETPTLAVVEALWTLHNGVFGVLQLSLAVALLGLSQSAVAAGLVHRAFRWIGPVGAVLLAVGAVAAPDVAAGRAAPAMGLAGLGFLAWLVTMTATSIGLLRVPADD